MIVRSPAFPNLDGLVGLAQNDGVDIRPTLLRVLTDLYIQKPTHSSEEERHYTELALRLIDVVDMPVRAIVAMRLARHPGAPLPVLNRLARDVIEVAQPILAHSPVLSQRELLSIAQECGSRYAAVIASRSEFAPSGQPPAADDDSAIRQRAPAEELSELFFSADAAERRLILLNLDFAPLPTATPMPAAIAEEANRRLELAALQHNTEGFAQELERTFAISRAHARRITDDPLGEPIAISAKALSMPSAMLQRVMLFVNPAIGRSVSRVYELSGLYEEITLPAVLRLLAIWQATDAKDGRRGHQPYHWHDAKDAAQAPARRTAEHAKPEQQRGRG